MAHPPMNSGLAGVLPPNSLYDKLRRVRRDEFGGLIHIGIPRATTAKKYCLWRSQKGPIKEISRSVESRFSPGLKGRRGWLCGVNFPGR